ncbi:MAG: SUF system NifU family Fe-S cluster assembly protein [Deinococcales bacterium]
MGFLDEIYKDIILDHYKKPRNRGTAEDIAAEDVKVISQEGLNPSCGDELLLHLAIETSTEARLKDVRFSGEGCAISQASASMMTVALRGKSIDEALALSQHFKEMIQGKGINESLGELKMLQGISKLHARVKCATLAWVTLEQALLNQKR